MAALRRQVRSNAEPLLLHRAFVHQQQHLRRVHIGGRGRSGAEIEIVARAQDDVRVAFADLLPEAGDIVTAGIGVDVV